jgi:hypothetical protein
MISIKKFAILVMSFFLLSTHAKAAPDSIISIHYYKTSAKEKLVGYWYQSCYLQFKAFWGERTSYTVAEPGLHGQDCTQLGMSGNNRGRCFAEEFDANDHDTWILESDRNRITNECEAETPIYTFPGGL